LLVFLVAPSHAASPLARVAEKYRALQQRKQEQERQWKGVTSELGTGHRRTDVKEVLHLTGGEIPVASRTVPASVSVPMATMMDEWTEKRAGQRTETLVLKKDGLYRNVHEITNEGVGSSNTKYSHSSTSRIKPSQLRQEDWGEIKPGQVGQVSDAYVKQFPKESWSTVRSELAMLASSPLLRDTLRLEPGKSIVLATRRFFEGRSEVTEQLALRGDGLRIVTTGPERSKESKAVHLAGFHLTGTSLKSEHWMTQLRPGDAQKAVDEWVQAEAHDRR
jgi:hypothetical protein